MAFKMIRHYSQENQGHVALDGHISELFESKLPLPEIFIHYFESDAQYADYLIVRYFLYFSEARGRHFSFKAQNLSSSFRSKTALNEYLSTRAASILSMIKSGSSAIDLQSTIHKICEKIYKRGIIEAIGRDEKLRQLTEKMILGISDALIGSIDNINSTASRKLQAMHALSSVIN